MTNPNFPDDEDKPLDPTLEKIRRKMVRLLVISGSVIVLGLMAVVVAIVQKTGRNSSATAPQIAADNIPTAQSVALPKGFTLESTTVDGNRIWFMGEAGGRHVILVHDIATGKTLTEITVAPQQ